VYPSIILLASQNANSEETFGSDFIKAPSIKGWHCWLGLGYLILSWSQGHFWPSATVDEVAIHMLLAATTEKAGIYTSNHTQLDTIGKHP
jgi:hypothetical protein